MSATIAVRVDESLKKEASELYSALGLDMSTAVKLFLVQSIRQGGIPFEIKRGITDAEFQKMVEEKLEGRLVSISDPESVLEFFGDEDFSEYNDLFEE
ncbi:type II toxin-antitoxin system RelB/DinJ family antitoxin [Streptococcus merionis]|uniref:type II toxin-antitoxin system RelB/DinJ family antitoxin n=1 Tax=Streptococcus merionis TaxID=400065 RepID=UPI003511158C